MVVGSEETEATGKALKVILRKGGEVQRGMGEKSVKVSQ
jgi:hypothetical protein